MKISNLEYITVLLAALLLLPGCGKHNQATHGPVPAPEPHSANPASNSVAGPSETQAHPMVSTPVIQPILTVWQEGHTETAINTFLEANWNARPIFPASMALGLTDAQMKGLPDDERQLKTNEMLAQLGLIKQLITAVNDAGQQAASKGDAARARRCFTSLKQFGAVLDSPGNHQLVRWAGQVSKNMANAGLAKLGP